MEVLLPMVLKMEGRQEKHGGRVSKPYSWRIAMKLRTNRCSSTVNDVERTTIFEECSDVIARYLLGKEKENSIIRITKDDGEGGESISTTMMTGDDGDDDDDDDHDSDDLSTGTIIRDPMHHVDAIRRTARTLWHKRVGVLIKGSYISIYLSLYRLTGVWGYGNSF